ncbi:MAG: DUF3987 domain-containing protein [Chloroflexaceae bacterium]|nr:DUF3987 domain-containing protein [Chloroflexaceae bacterium]
MQTNQQLAVNGVSIPDELKARDQWVLWRYVARNGKQTKVPYQCSGTAAKSSDPETWAPFDAVWSEYQQHPTRWAGVGFVFSPDDPFVGVDLDDCILEDGTLTDRARTIVDQLDTYCEVSPSGRGLKLWARGAAARSLANELEGVEVYGCGRYFTCTGQRLDGTPATISEAQPVLDWLVATYGTHQRAATNGHAPAPAATPLVATLDTGDEQARLWAQAMAGGNGHSNGNGHYADRPNFDKVAAACAAINPSRWDAYSEWIGLGMSLHAWDSGAVGLQLWESHSRSSPKWIEGECARKWQGFRSSGFTIGTVLGCANQDDPAWFDRFVSSKRAAPARDAAAAVRSTLHLDQGHAVPATPRATPVPTPKRITACPVDVLPAPVRAICERVASATETPVELGVMLALATLATSVQRRVRVAVRTDWQEEVTFYTIVVLPSGGGKTPVLKHIARPIHVIEEEMISHWEEQKREFGRMTPVEQKENPLPPMPCLITSDTTSEKLAKLLRDQGERMAALSAEGGLLEIIGGRYSPQGMTGALDVYLQAWCGERMTVDRAKVDESFKLKRPCLSIGLALQPATLERLANADHLQERGFLARFLIVTPETTRGKRLHPDTATATVVDDWHASQWESLIRQLWAIPDGTVLMLDPAGYDLLQAFARELEPRLDGDLAPIAPVVDKHKSQIVRIAALLMLASDPSLTGGVELGGEHIAHAIRFYRWALDHQIAAQRLTSEVAPVTRAIGKIAAWIGRWCVAGDTVSFRQVQRGSNLDKARTLEALVTLDELGLIQEVETKRRDSRWYTVGDVDAITAYAAQLDQEMTA